jgi:hypothetical protein
MAVHPRETAAKLASAATETRGTPLDVARVALG